MFAGVEAMNFGLKYEMGRNYFLKQVRNRVMKQTQGVYPAPLKIIDVCFLSNFIIYYVLFIMMYRVEL